MHSKKYKVTITTQSPVAIENAIGGTGILEALTDTIKHPIETPFRIMDLGDFDPEDETVGAFKSMGGPAAIVEMVNKNDIHGLKECHSKLSKIRLASRRAILRYAFSSIKSAEDNNEATNKMEKVAYKLPSGSKGYHQVEAVKAIDELIKDTLDRSELLALNNARGYVLSGNEYKYAGKIVKSLYDVIMPSTRLAYTSLSTQNNEPYLLCPKGKVELGYAVPMEISKCRENCIDSRVSKEGVVACAYQDWLRVVADSHEKMEKRLNVTRHPLNAENLLNLVDGERSKKPTENEIGYEARFETSKKGGHTNPEYSRSLEYMLGEAKPKNLGRRDEEEPKKRSKKAQTDSTKVINEQLPHNENKESTREESLRSLKNPTFNFNKTVQENLDDSDSLIAHRGEMDKLYAEILNTNEEPETSISEQINKDAGDGSDESTAHLLNKTAKKKEEEDLSFESHLSEARHNKVNDKTIDELLEAEGLHTFEDDDYNEFYESLFGRNK